MGQERISVREIARRTGVPRTTVQRWANAGVLGDLDPEGRLPLKAVGIVRHQRTLSQRVGDVASDPEQAAAGPADEPPAAPGALPAEAPARRRGGGERDAAMEAVAELKTQLLTAQVHEKEAKAELAQLRAAHQRGEYVLLQEVVADARGAAEVIRSALLALPARVALQVEALAARGAGPPRAPEIEALIADEINIVLIALQGSRYAR